MIADESSPLIVSDIPCPANHHNWLYCWTNGKDIGSCNGKLGMLFLMNPYAVFFLTCIGRVTNENFYVEVTADQGCAKMKPGEVLGPL